MREHHEATRRVRFEPMSQKIRQKTERINKLAHYIENQQKKTQDLNLFYVILTKEPN